MAARSVLSLCCLILVSALSTLEAMELTNKSSDTMVVAQGEKLSIFCESDQPYDYCQWEHVEKQIKCNLASSGIDTAMDCSTSNNRIMWDVHETRCGITIDQATREDVGHYKCYLFAGNTSNSVEQTTQVDVAVPARVSFDGVLASDSTIKVKEGDVIIIECRAADAYPSPQLRAALGADPGPISANPKADTILTEVSHDEIPNPDGTFDIVKQFTIVAQAHDCGKYIKCESSQLDRAGNELFGPRGKVVEKRKLDVLFAPEALLQSVAPVAFSPEDHSKTVQLQFMANPAPANNEAIWTINQIPGQVGPDSAVVQAGRAHKDKYEAPPLNVTGHAVVATLIIRNLDEADAGYEYFLDVKTAIGSQKYPFKLEFRPEYANEPAPTDETDEETEESTDPSKSGMGIGIVVAIIIVAIIVLAAIAGVIWMRANKRFCFATGTTKPTPNPAGNGGSGVAADVADQAERGEGGDPAEKEKLNQKNGL